MSIRRTTSIWRSPQRASSETTTATIVSMAGNEVAGIALKNCESEDNRIYMKKNLETGVIRLGRKVNEPPRDGEALYNCKVVSRDHAIISFRRQGGVYITDTGSTHGTSVVRSGITIPLTPGSRKRLTNGDTLVLGKQVLNDDQVTHPLQLNVKLILHSRNSPEMQLSSPNRYMIPVNVGDTSESENEDQFDSRSFAPLPSRARNSAFPSPSPLRSVISMASLPGSPISFKRPKLFDDFLSQIEGVKAAISSATDELGNIRNNANESSEVEKRKYDDLQTMIAGFHEQQEKMARDHEEQMQLIRQLQQRMAAEAESAEPSCDQVSLKRKADEPDLNDSERVVTSQPSDSNDAKVTSQLAPPVCCHPNRRRGILTKTVSTLGTLTLGAAMMWYGLSEMSI